MEQGTVKSFNPATHFGILIPLLDSKHPQMFYDESGKEWQAGDGIGYENTLCGIRTRLLYHAADVPPTPANAPTFNPAYYGQHGNRDYLEAQETQTKKEPSPPVVESDIAEDLSRSPRRLKVGLD